jgi:hypothetical protein
MIIIEKSFSCLFLFHHHHKTMYLLALFRQLTRLEQKLSSDITMILSILQHQAQSNTQVEEAGHKGEALQGAGSEGRPYSYTQCIDEEDEDCCDNSPLVQVCCILNMFDSHN